MEEDIKILEEIIEYCKEHLPPYYKDEDLQAIENLIKGYRELEEYYKEQNEVNAKFIPKSKIKEIRDKAEVMDYYTLPDVIDDLNKLLEV